MTDASTYNRANEKNVGEGERWVSVIFGTALAGYGLTKRTATGYGMALLGGALVWRGTVGYCPVYDAAGLSTAVEHQGRQVSVPYGRGKKVEHSVVVSAPADRVFDFWRNFENLPRFMNNLESVQVHDEKRSHWVAKGPAGTKVEWEAEIINEVPDELIGWRSVEGSQVDNAGSVRFTPINEGRATEVRVVIRYDPPAGVVGAKVSKLLGEDPDANIREDLERLKRLLEGDLAR